MTAPGSSPPSARRRPSHPPSRSPLGAVDAAVYETFVVPRYMSLYGELMLEMLAEIDDAQVAHLFCRTGHPDRALLAKLPGGHLYGCDPSPFAVELARAKALASGAVTEYRVVETLPTSFPSGAFSHACTLHPFGPPEHRRRLLQELARLLAPHGQALLALPLRGSFQEVADLLREFALKHEHDEVSKAVEAAVLLRPTVEMLKEDFVDGGFDFVEVEVRPAKLTFDGGKAFLEDPVSRLVLFPEFRLNLDLADFDEPMRYVSDAIDRYWSEGEFELSFEVACATGRRKGA